MSKFWIEAALNGPWGKHRQPGIPITVAEAIADGVSVVNAGAAIVHVHAYDASSGHQNDDWNIYAAIIEGIRNKVDAIIYPTIPAASSGFDGESRTPSERYAHVEELAKRGLLEMSAVDPGSVTLARFDELSNGGNGFVYQNSLDHIREGLRIATEYSVRPCYAIYEPGFTRLGSAAAQLYPAVHPIYRFMFSDEFAWGFPPRPLFLQAHISMLSELNPHSPWMVAGLGVNILPLLPEAIKKGGHVRVGLEDAPWGSKLTNREWVEAAVKKARQFGAEPSTAADVRSSLSLLDSSYQELAACMPTVEPETN